MFIESTYMVHPYIDSTDSHYILTYISTIHSVKYFKTFSH